MEHVENKASKNIIEDNIEKLKDLFPEAFTESSDEGEPRWKVNFETLKQILGNYSEDRQERYSFSWNGKSRARLIAQTPSTGTLRPCPEESVDWDSTKNLFIEGDNLEVLKLLQKSYHKKVKMIYIDPPYNTGNEFIYPDKFQDNLDTYMRYTGQVDDEGFKVSTNSETGGRYHTNWLNMMYPRLKLARNLLRDDGVIFISIDDNEVANLRKICDEIFGEENFIANIVWQKKTSPDARMEISSAHDHILLYTKVFELFHLNSLPMTAERRSSYTNPDNDPRGPWASVDLTGQTGRAPKSQFYEIETPSGLRMKPPQGRCWALAESTFRELRDDNRIWFGKNGKNRPRLKKFLSEGEGIRPWTWWDNNDVGHNQEGNKEVKKIFDDNVVFDNPKPTRLLQRIIQIASNQSEEEIVLDFFAGSGSFAHSTLLQNFIDNGRRRYVAIQLPEKIQGTTNDFKADAVASKLGYFTIAEIGKERIRRAGKKLREENPDYDGDIGFKVFKLDSSNIKPWDADFDNYKEALMNSVENIKTERTEQDVLYELLLKYGLDLTIPIETRSIQGKNVYIIGAGALVVCLDDEITLDAVEGIAKLKEELKPEIMRVVFKDAGFKDATVKTNTVQILKIAGIEDVKSL